MLARKSAEFETGFGAERMVSANGIDICTQAIGDPRHPAILLVQGACVSMIRWEDDFCVRLAGAGRYVVRFDNRDTGRSTCFEAYRPEYDMRDMARDTVGVLDAYGIERAHVVGASSGGMIGQLMALDHPERVATLTAAISTPDPRAILAANYGEAQPAGNDLPSPLPSMSELVQALAKIDWLDKASAVEGFLVEARFLAGSRYPLDEAAMLEMAIRDVNRARDILCMRFNTPLAETRTPPWRHRLGDIAAPTLVIHGTEDPLLPYGHSVALAAEIQGASLVTMQGVGHYLPRQVWDDIVPAILAHTKGPSTEIFRESHDPRPAALIER